MFNFGGLDRPDDGLTPDQRERIAGWMSYDTTGTRHTFLDPAIPAVQDYLLLIVQECLAKYPVDGVNLDFIRYPEEEAGYHPEAVARFDRLTSRTGTPKPNDPEWNAFRRAQVTGFVRRCAAAVWRMKPDAMFTVCAVGFGGVPADGDFTHSSPYRQVHQDWAGWAREGTVDIVTRMGYKRESVPAHAKQFRDWADFSKRLADESSGPLVTLGIGGYFNTLDGTLAQYAEARRRGLGTSLFSYWRPVKESDTTKQFGPASPFWATLGERVYPQPAPPPRPDWRKKVGVLTGLALDAAGKPMDSVEVALTGPGPERHLATDGGGWFVFVNLGPGTYTVSVPGSRTDGKKATIRGGDVVSIE